MGSGDPQRDSPVPGKVPAQAGQGRVCEMRIAMDRPDGKGTDYVDIAAWGRLDEVCGSDLAKGRLVEVIGKLRHEQWTSEAGVSRQRLLVVAAEVTSKAAKPKVRGGGGVGGHAHGGGGGRGVVEPGGSAS